jgi:LacI family transcriptional regulator
MQRRGGGASGREKPGVRTVVTLEDVARAAGVHYSTVSRALDPERVGRVNVATRKHVQAVAKRMGYQKDMVASGLKRGRTHTVAVVVGDLGNPNVPPLLRGISNRLEPAGLMALIVETQNDPARLEWILDHLLSRRVDAVIVTAARLGDGPTLRRIRRQGIPIVLAVQTVPGVRLPAFTHDDILGGSLAAQHLLALGHRRVVQLRGPADIYSCLQRAQGFSQTIAAAGATEVVLRSTGPMGTAEEGARLMKQLLDSKRALPTGIFAHHDLMAYGAMSMAEERGLVCPRDFSMIGYNDLPNVERMVPPLTSVRLPREELGGLAAEVTVKMLSSADRPLASRKLAPTLVVRQSTGPPKDFR